MKIVKRVLDVEFESKHYKIKFPTVKKQMEFSKKYEKEKDDYKKFDIAIGFLDELGLPKNITNDFEADHLMQILKAFGESGKK